MFQYDANQAWAWLAPKNAPHVVAANTYGIPFADSTTTKIYSSEDLNLTIEQEL